MIEHRICFIIFFKGAVFEFIFAEYFGKEPYKNFSRVNNLLKQKKNP